MSHSPSPSIKFKPATISQPPINSIPPSLLPRFDPIFAAYHTHYSAGRLATHQIPIEEMRKNPQKYQVVYGRAIAPDVHAITNLRCPVAPAKPKIGEGEETRSITVRVFEPKMDADGKGKKRPIYVNYHGGGWVFGGLETDFEFCKRLVNELGCVVFDVDYRLAPEYPWPIPVEDSIAAFKWIVSDAMLEKYCLDRERVAVGGISAGGMLAAVLAHVCRDEGLPLSFQLLGVPAVDMDGFGKMGEMTEEGWRRWGSYTEMRDTVPLPVERMSWFAGKFLGVPRGEETYNNFKVSPYHAKNFAGLAPALIMTAEMDPLRDEGEAYGRKMNEAGSRAEVIRMGGMPHTFMMMDDILEGGMRYNREAVRALGEVWGLAGKKGV
ncbi:AB hydrolase superfamily protein [Rutstroemia sp. NJR-2017a WRK4]|nr:AB hydrolase superfamily protein [Rutstroemia sp. NJR-2017a WRK4]